MEMIPIFISSRYNQLTKKTKQAKPIGLKAEAKPHDAPIPPLTIN